MSDAISDAVRREPRSDGDLFTRRQWLTIQATLAGGNIWMAIEAVSSVAIEHPEWDMDEERTWEQWQSS